jgi:AhpD family alkylhydroperoxidase
MALPRAETRRTSLSTSIESRLSRLLETRNSVSALRRTKKKSRHLRLVRASTREDGSYRRIQRRAQEPSHDVPDSHERNCPRERTGDAEQDRRGLGYLALNAKGSLTPAEQQLIAVAASRENGCAYCVAAHSTLALSAKLPEHVLRAGREGRATGDGKLSALRLVTELIVRQRGWLSEAEKRAFLDAGYTSGQLLEVVGWICMKTLTNYTNHLAETPVDPEWQRQSWAPGR